MAKSFEVGEVVTLKSGGPEMTVQKILDLSGGTMVRCQWFGGRKLENDDFPPASLVYAETDSDA